MKINKDYKLNGFSILQTSKTEYTRFLKKINNPNYLILKKTNNLSVFFEMTNPDFMEWVIYIFKISANGIQLKASAITFLKKPTKQDIKDKKFLDQILVKSEDRNYLLTPSANLPYGVFNFR